MCAGGRWREGGEFVGLVTGRRDTLGGMDHAGAEVPGVEVTAVRAEEDFGGGAAGMEGCGAEVPGGGDVQRGEARRGSGGVGRLDRVQGDCAGGAVGCEEEGVRGVEGEVC